MEQISSQNPGTPAIAPSSNQVIGVDLGGTAIKLGRFDAAGECLQSLTVPTPQGVEPVAVVEAIAQAIAQLDPEGHALAIGVGTPGPVDETGRIALVAINLGWKDVPLADWLEAKTGKPVVAANDANCAGMGEAWLGAGCHYRDVILLTLGTGVGGAVLLDGHLFTGRQGTGAELGLITLDPSGETCNSGNHGSLEQLVSIQAIRRRTGLEPAELGKRAAAGDAEAIAFWQTYGRDLGAGIANLVYIFTPEVVILGGGISASAPFFLPSLWDEIRQRVLPTSRDGLQVLTAALGNQAGMVGAARLAWEVLANATPSAVAEPPSATDWAYHAALECARFNGGFLARTAHELRSPLNGIIGLQQLILNDLCDSPEEEREFVQQAYRSALKMLDLLDEVIRISKVTADSLTLCPKAVPLNGLFQNLREMTHLQAQDRNIRLDIPSIDPMLHIVADPDWLQQVLLHRVDGAIAQMDGGFVRVGVIIGDTDATLWVEDSRPAADWTDDLACMQRDRIPLPLQPSKDHAAHLQPLDTLSPGLLLQMDHLILQRMGSQMEWSNSPEPDRIRLQFRFPRV